ALEYSIHQTEIAIIKTGLQAADCRRADNPGRLADIHALQAGGAAEQGLGGDSESRTNHTALIFALRRHAIECGCSAKVNDDAGPAMFLKRRDAVHNAVGAHFGGILVQYRHSSFNTRLDEQRLVAEVALAHTPQ